MRWTCLLPLALLLGGCSGEDASITGVLGPAPKVADIGEPRFDARTPLAVVAENGQLRLGGSRLEAIKAFPKPDLANQVSDLPALLRGQSGYSAESWTYGNSGFGTIMYGDRVALATRVTEKMTEDQFRTLVDDTRRANGNERTPAIGGRFARYYFWQSDDQRLMICGFRAPDSSWTSTVALGESPLMDALGMSEERANVDKDSADAALGEYYQKQKMDLPPKPPAPGSQPIATPTPGGFLHGFGG